MEKIVPQFYQEFGNYRISNQMVSNHMDGCVPVWRRCLLGVHDMARTDFKKTATVLGYIMMHYHPHGEATESMRLLVLNNFIEKQGQWGSKIGKEEEGCAHPRYTEVKAKNFIEELAFKYVNYVPWERDECDLEPLYLPTLIPICLFNLYEKSNIVFGFKTLIPSFKISDLIKRQMYLVTKDPKLKEIITPRIIGCEITSDKTALEKVLNHNISKIEGKGILVKDPDNFRIYIKGWSPRDKFESIFNAIDRKSKLLTNNDIIVNDDSNRAEGTSIRVEINRNRNRANFYDKMEEAIENAITFKMNYDIYSYHPIKKELLRPSVDELLINSFEMFKSTVNTYFNKQIEKYSIQIEEITVIEKIRPFIGDIIKIKSEEEQLSKLSELTTVPVEAIKIIIDKYRIKSLLTTRFDKDDLKNKVSELKDKLKNIDTEILNEVKQIFKDSKKYEESIKIF